MVTVLKVPKVVENLKVNVTEGRSKVMENSETFITKERTETLARVTP